VDTTIGPTEKKQKQQKKKDKVRSAWISFAGRIAAQLVGAVATVGLGVVMLNRYAAPNHAVPGPEPQQPAITVIVVSPSSETPQGFAAPADPASGLTASQAEMARAIARAVSATVPHVD
jgi:hypothetical protein